jgi:hypothetical protein
VAKISVQLSITLYIKMGRNRKMKKKADLGQDVSIFLRGNEN